MSFVSTMPASKSTPTLPSTPASFRLQVRLRHLHALRLSSPLPRPTFQNRFCHRSPVVRALPQRPDLATPCSFLSTTARRRQHASPVAVRKSHLHPRQALPPRSPRPLHVAKRLSVDDVTRFARLRFLPRLARRARRSLLVAEHRPRVASPRWALRARSCGGPLSCLPLGRPSSDKPNHELVFTLAKRSTHPRPSRHNSIELPCYECGHTFPARHALSMHAVHAHTAQLPHATLDTFTHDRPPAPQPAVLLLHFRIPGRARRSDDKSSRTRQPASLSGCCICLFCERMVCCHHGQIARGLLDLCRPS